jgi:DNA-binding transcriptional regulator of glucitol operon
MVFSACVVMVLLGRWQWRVAHVHHGDVRNYAYAFQWWAFTAFALLMWARILRDTAKPGGPIRAVSGRVAEPVPYRRYVMPQHSTAVPMADDAEHARYNAYLDALARSGEPPEQTG